VSAENRHCIGWHFGKILHKARAFGFQAFDYKLVVHDLVAHINRRSIFFQGTLDDFNRAHDAGTEPAGLRQHHLYGVGPSCVRLHCVHFHRTIKPAPSRTSLVPVGRSCVTPQVLACSCGPILCKAVKSKPYRENGPLHDEHLVRALRKPWRKWLWHQDLPLHTSDLGCHDR
jgi:hypothetical protein